MVGRYRGEYNESNQPGLHTHKWQQGVGPRVFFLFPKERDVFA
jgi:hypothetical protein